MDKRVAIICIGNEILAGKTVDTNSVYISRNFAGTNYKVVFKAQIGDSADEIRNTLNFALKLADVVFTTGGLGPTFDDITKKTIADYFGLKLEIDENLLQKTREFFRKRGIEMPESNITQALVPEGTEYFENPLGTAPAIKIKSRGKTVFLLPGVPREMETLLEYILTSLNVGKENIKTIRIYGIRESVIQEKLDRYIGGERKYMALLPSYRGVDIRFYGGSRRIEKLVEKISDTFKPYIYGEGDILIEEVVGKIFREKNLTLSIAESCTGGLVAHLITNVPGSSDYFLGGVSAYHNSVKINALSVNKQSLKDYGAVSEVVAKEMAVGVKKSMHADIGISTTGIAGPTGGTKEKPVGLVWMAVADKKNVNAKQKIFSGEREDIKFKSSIYLLNMLRKFLKEKR